MNARNALVLSRHVVWLVAFLVVLTALVSIRLDVAELRENLDRRGHDLEVSETLHGRLAAQLDARRQAAAMEATAESLGLDEPAHIVDVHLGEE